MGMSPSRKCKVGSVKVEEFYWGGRWPVYIDNRLTTETYPQAVERLEKEELRTRYATETQVGDE